MNTYTQQRLHTGFLSSALHYPNLLALSIGCRQWRYKEVDEIARRWASALLTNSERPKQVGIFASRSEVSYIAILASLYAGATFVPLNPAFPVERTRLMIREGRLDALFVDDKAASQLTGVLSGIEVPVVLLPETDGSLLTPTSARLVNRSEILRCSPLADLIEVSCDTPAYLLFTSGSTGYPKGVPITHRNIVHFLNVSQQRYLLQSDDRLTQAFEQTFDASIFDLFMAWWSGACASCIHSIELLSPFSFVRERNITWWNSVPSVIALLQKKNLLLPNSLANLRWSLFGGEALTSGLAEAWQVAAPNSIIENVYGPTEATVACAVYRWNSETSSRECVNKVVPIGQVFSGLHHLVVDEALQEVLPGETGELCIAGPQVFSGYWCRPNLTRERTFRRSLSGCGELLFFRTGDRVRLLGSNNYAFIGRTDHQLQVNGYRVELGEIEGILLNEPNISQAVVLGWPIEDGRTHGIVAFVTGSHLKTDSLVVVLSSRLPAYMVPRSIFCLDSMPLNRNGKIDRTKLYFLLSQGFFDYDTPSLA